MKSEDALSAGAGHSDVWLLLLWEIMVYAFCKTVWYYFFFLGRRTMKCCVQVFPMPPSYANCDMHSRTGLEMIYSLGAEETSLCWDFTADSDV